MITLTFDLDRGQGHQNKVTLWENLKGMVYNIGGNQA